MSIALDVFPSPPIAARRLSVVQGDFWVNRFFDLRTEKKQKIASRPRAFACAEK
jgi:hypothetical protein